MVDEWEEIALEDVASEITVGHVGSMASEYVDCGVPFLRSLNIEPFRVNEADIKYITPEFHAKLKKSTLRPGDVVIVRTGKPGATAIIPEWLGEANCSDLVIVRPGKELDRRFLVYVMNSVAQRHVSAHLVGAVQQHFNVGSARALKMRLPPLIEQQAIACILGALDDKIDLNRRRSRTLEGMARAIFQSWFVDFDPVRKKCEVRRVKGEKGRSLPPSILDLFPSHFELHPSFGPIPAGWRVGTVGDLVEINGWTLGKRDPLDEIDYIEISEVMRGEVATVTRYARGAEPGRARRRLRHGDTALSTVRPDRGSYFLSIEPSPNLIASTGFAVLTAKRSHWGFVHVLTTRREFGDELGRLADGGAYPAVRPEVIAARPAIIPASDQVVVAFEKIAQPMFSSAEKARQESLTLAAFRGRCCPS
jgi:type I restriction enzyme S subunit